MTKRTIVIFIILTLFAAGVYFIWNSEQQTKIITIAQDDTVYEIFLLNPPKKTKEQLRWLQKNQNILKEVYNIPENPERFYLSFWDIKGGFRSLEDRRWKYYQEPDDAVCFEGIPTPLNCLEKKNFLFNIQNIFNNKTYISTKDGKDFEQDSEGNITPTKIKSSIIISE